jgi:DNA-directed RNA polymerase specialized sigma24 family protein
MSQPVDMGEAILRSLTGAMARRDTVAFLAFYAAISPEVYARLLAAIPDRRRAGALTECVFVRAWHQASECGTAQTVRAWLTGIVDDHAVAGPERGRLRCVRGEFRRLLCRAGADADVLRWDRRTGLP